MKFLKIAAAFAALSIAGAASQASANIYQLTVSPDLGNGNYGTITTTQNGLNVDVNVTLNAGYQFVTTGGPHTLFTFNSNDPSYGVTSITPLTVTHVQPGSQPSFGTFTDGFVCASCGNGGPGAFTTPINFTVTNTTLANFVPNGPNNTGYVFAADIRIIDGGATGSVGALQSVDINQLGVPETATWAMMILGMGMVGIGLRLRRRAPTAA